jgi:hypothetical protein
MDNEIETVPLTEEEPTNDDPQQSSPADFPEEAFTGFFRRYRDLVEPCTEAPPVYHWVTFLTMVGLLLGRSVFIRFPFPLYPNFYSLLIGRTGIDRKSTAMKCGDREILQRIPNNIVHVKGALSSEGIYEVLAKQRDTRLLLYCDEMRSFLNISNRQGTADIIPRLNTLYDCPDSDDLTRSRAQSIQIDHPFVSFIAGTPKEWLTDAIGGGEIMGGFVNRFLPVEGMSNKSIPFPKPADDQTAKQLAAELTKIIDQCTNLPVELEWSAGANGMYEKFYDAWHQRQSSLSTETAAITNRIPNHVVKIAMVYSILDGRSEITDHAIATAIQIGDYLERTAISIFADTGLSKQGRVEQMIISRLKSNGGIMEYRKLQRALGGKTDAESFNRAIRNLIIADVIKILPTKTTPKMVVYLGD